MRSRIGRPATRSIGLGTVSVSGRSRVPRPPAMTTARLSRGDVAQERVQQVQRDRAARGVERRGSRRSGGPRIRSSTSTRDLAGVRRRRTAVQDTAPSGSSRPRPREQGAAEVAVGGDADQPAVRRRPRARSRRRRGRSACERVADRGVAPGRCSRASSSVTRRHLGRAGTPSTVAPSGTSATTTAPIPTVAPAPIAMWSRTARPEADRTCPPRSSSRRRSVAPGATWAKPPTRTSCSTTAPELTMRVRADARAGVHDGAGEDDRARLEPRRSATTQAAGWTIVAQLAPSPIAAAAPRRAGRRARRTRGPASGRSVRRRVSAPARRHRAAGSPARVRRPRPGPTTSGRAVGRLGDDAGVLAGARGSRAGVAAHAGTRIGGLRGGLGGRHAAMICATRAPARPSRGVARAACQALADAGRQRPRERLGDRRGVRRDVEDVGVALAAGLAIADVDDRQARRPGPR